MEIPGKRIGLCCLTVALSTAGSLAWAVPQDERQQQSKPPQVTAPDWIRRSNENATLVRTMERMLAPEFAADDPSFDDKITDFAAGSLERAQQSRREVLAELRRRFASEKDPEVRSDLTILMSRVERDIREDELEDKYQLPYINPTDAVFDGIRPLLDDQISAERRPKALVRLREYAGIEPGTKPLTGVLEQRLREKLGNSKLMGPPRSLVERNLAQADLLLGEIPGLFEKYNVSGYQEAAAKLKEQVADYNEFIRKDLLPRCSNDFRLPPELYAFRLASSGIDISPAESAKRAHAGFRVTQAEMQKLAEEISAARHLFSSDYRNVIGELKKNQLEGDAIVTGYTQRLKDIEQVIVREKLITLPAGQPRIRLATKAESATALAPFSKCSSVFDKTPDQQCEFILPVNLPAGTAAKEAERIDDYTFAAASWTLAAHEMRPGHELQHDAMVAHGVPFARVGFGLNIVNAEGWAVYSEGMIRPYMPPEARLISLQWLLLREARAFLDPELQAGKISTTEAVNILKKDVVLSDALANSEVQRYTIFAPGSAPSYFYGYSEFVQLRKDVERGMGSRFSEQEFHDFVISQGTIPVPLIRKAVFKQLVKPRLQAATPAGPGYHSEVNSPLHARSSPVGEKQNQPFQLSFNASLKVDFQ
jgi:hypothetical protein